MSVSSLARVQIKYYWSWKVASTTVRPSDAPYIPVNVTVHGVDSLPHPFMLVVVSMYMRIDCTI